MTDTTLSDMPTMSETLGPPPLALSLIHDFAQKALTAAAGALAARGLIAPSQEDALVQLGVGAVLFAASCAWTLTAARLRDARFRALARLAAGKAEPASG